VLAAEDDLQALWRQSFAAFTSSNEELEERFVRRGCVLRSRIYPDKLQRRRLYKTGLPPRSGAQLLSIYPELIRFLKTGKAYASWNHVQRFEYVAQAVNLISTIDRFSFPERLNRRVVNWKDVLAWWFDPVGRPHDPGPRRRAEWFSYVSTNFVYRF